MPAKEEHGCDSGSESLDKHEPRDMLKDVIKVSLLQKGQNDRIKNIAFVFYGIQCSLNILSWVRPSWQIPAQTITHTSP